MKIFDILIFERFFLKKLLLWEWKESISCNISFILSIIYFKGVWKEFLNFPNWIKTWAFSIYKLTDIEKLYSGLIYLVNSSSIQFKSIYQKLFLIQIWVHKLIPSLLESKPTHAFISASISDYSDEMLFCSNLYLNQFIQHDLCLNTFTRFCIALIYTQASLFISICFKYSV